MASTRFAKTPEKGYYAVIFSSTASDNTQGYGAMAEAMSKLALTQSGCLGMESTCDTFGFGITVSYWVDEASILEWKQNAKHAVAQNAGLDTWYSHYEIRVAKIERSYSGPKGRAKVTG